MMETLLVIGAVLVGLLVLLALIVSLSARPTRGQRSTARSTGWEVDSGRKHPGAWDPATNTTLQVPR